MPPTELTTNANNEDPGPINPVVGIIYPPPEVRSILLGHFYNIFISFYFLVNFPEQNALRYC